MYCKSFFVSVVLMVTIPVFPHKEAAAGTATGHVRDYGKPSPTDGISGAKVWLQLAPGKQTTTVITDTDGQYRMTNVPNGAYTLVVDKVGYIPRPHEQTKLNIKGNILVPDVILWVENATTAYYEAAAGRIVKMRANAKPEIRAGWYTSQWGDLRAINLPPSSRAVLAKELNKQDASAAKLSPEVQTYLAASPEEISKAEILFGNAIAGKGNIPEKDSLSESKLPQAVVADVVLSQLKDSTAPKEKRDAFVKEFVRKWDDTLVLKHLKITGKGEW